MIKDLKNVKIEIAGRLAQGLARFVHIEEVTGSNPVVPTMKQFLEKNKIFLAIIIGALIIGAAIYVSSKNQIPKQGEVKLANGQCLALSEVIVTKVIDGDTIVIEGGYHLRLLGIDTDENGYPCYTAAKLRLEELVLNKKVELEKDQTDVDQYGRCLRYVFLNDENINLQLVEEGLAIARFYEPDVKYREVINKAEKEAIENKVGCKWEEKGIDNEGYFIELTPEKTGLEVILACDAEDYIGKEIIVEGKVVAAYKSATDTIFLNFEKAYPNQCFTAVIFSSNQSKFVKNPQNYYSGKTVRVKGKIKDYQGKPEIILDDVLQIELGI